MKQNKSVTDGSVGLQVKLQFHSPGRDGTNYHLIRPSFLTHHKWQKSKKRGEGELKEHLDIVTLWVESMRPVAGSTSQKLIWMEDLSFAPMRRLDAEHFRGT